MQCLSQPISMCHGLRWKTGLTSCMQCLSQPMSMCHGLRWKTCSWTYEGGSICRQGSAILLQIASCTRLSKPFAEASDKIACHLRRATIHGIKNIFFRKNWWGYLSQRDKKTVNGILHDSSAQAIRWNILSANGGSGNIQFDRGTFDQCSLIELECSRIRQWRIREHNIDAMLHPIMAPWVDGSAHPSTCAIETCCRSRRLEDPRNFEPYLTPHRFFPGSYQIMFIDVHLPSGKLTWQW